MSASIPTSYHEKNGIKLSNNLINEQRENILLMFAVKLFLKEWKKIMIKLF